MTRWSNIKFFKDKVKTVYNKSGKKIVEIYISPRIKIDEWFSLKIPDRYNILQEHLELMEGRYHEDIARQYCVNCGNYGIRILRDVIRTAVKEGMLEKELRQLEENYRLSIYHINRFAETGKPYYVPKKGDLYTRQQKAFLSGLIMNPRFIHKEGNRQGKLDWVRITRVFNQTFFNLKDKDKRNLALNYSRLKKRNNNLRE